MHQAKVVHLLCADHGLKGDTCFLKVKFLGKNNLECKRVLENFGLTAYFTNKQSQRGTLLKCVRASYWWRTPVT